MRLSLRRHNDAASGNPHPLPNLPLPRPGLLIGRDRGKGEEHNHFSAFRGRNITIAFLLQGEELNYFPPLQGEGKGGGGIEMREIKWD